MRELANLAVALRLMAVQLSGKIGNTLGRTLAQGVDAESCAGGHDGRGRKL